MYEDLINEAERLGLSVKEKYFKSNAKGLIKGNSIGIRRDVPTLAEKACILAEELGHYHTSVGDILDQSKLANRKQELRARQWAYQCLIPLDRIVQAYKAQITGRYEISEYLGVTEEFLQSAIHRYTEKYGLYVKVDERYSIHFDPLGVIESFTE